MGKTSDEWFQKWFGKSDDRDQQIKDKFEDSVVAMRDGTCDGWLAHPRQCLAGIILMDQFTRNIYRGESEMCVSVSKSFCLHTLRALVWASRKHHVRTDLPFCGKCTHGRNELLLTAGELLSIRFPSSCLCYNKVHKARPQVLLR